MSRQRPRRLRELSHRLVSRFTADRLEACPRCHATENRFDRIARVRREIQAGHYDTPEKMELALEKLLGSLETD